MKRQARKKKAAGVWMLLFAGSVPALFFAARAVARFSWFSLLYMALGLAAVLVAVWCIRRSRVKRSRYIFYKRSR